MESHKGILLFDSGEIKDWLILECNQPLSVFPNKLVRALSGKSCATRGPKVESLGSKFVGVLRCANFGLLSVDESVAVVEDGAHDDEQEGADDEPSERLDLGKDDHQDELDRVHQRV